MLHFIQPPPPNLPFYAAIVTAIATGHDTAFGAAAAALAFVAIVETEAGRAQRTERVHGVGCCAGIAKVVHARFPIVRRRWARIR